MAGGVFLSTRLGTPLPPIHPSPRQNSFTVVDRSSTVGYRPQYNFKNICIRVCTQAYREGLEQDRDRIGADRDRTQTGLEQDRQDWGQNLDRIGADRE